MKILVGYDGSSPSQKALQLAEEHARVFGGEVDIITSMNEKSSVEQEMKAEDDLEKAKAAFNRKGIKCDTHLLIRGLSPGEDIVEFAKSNKVDEIVIGAKKRSRVGKLLLGSTAQYVILESPTPVVTIH